MAGCELEIPERDDDAVVEAIKFLNGKLRTDLMKNYLKEAGEYLYVATNATAKDADQQIKVQSCLFDAVKLCDAWNLMLTSFKVGASDILEKLHIAFLKLLDGFPDFALADVQSVTKHVSSMKTACEKARGSFTKCRQELKEVIAFLGTEKMKLEGNCNKSSTAYSEKIKRLERVCSDKAFEREDSSLRLAYLEREEPRDKYQAVKKMIPNCVLAEEELCLALQKLDEAVEFLGKVERLVNDWYNECKEVVEKNMKLNVKHAERMSEAEQKEFWKTLPFAQTAYQYLCRWKALQQICLSTSSHMRRVRGDIDWYYTENLYPSEAVQKAWELMEKHKDLLVEKRKDKDLLEKRKDKDLLEKRKDKDLLENLRPYPDMVVPGDGRNKALCFLPELMALPSTGTSKDIFKFKEYGSNFEKISTYLGVLESTSARLFCETNSPVQKIRQGLNTLVDLLHNATYKLSVYSFDAILYAHLASLCILDGMPEAAHKEVNTIWNDEKSDDLKKAIGHFAKFRAEFDEESTCILSQQQMLGEKVEKWKAQLKQAVKDEVHAALPGDTHFGQKRFQSVMQVGKAKLFGAATNDGVSNNIAEKIKFLLISQELLKLLSSQLPMISIVSIYEEISTDLTNQSVVAREELKGVAEALQHSSLGQESSGPDWQKGMVELLRGLKNLYTASREQAKSLEQVSKRFEKRSTRLNWHEYMVMVSKVDCIADSQARKIDSKVDDEVQRIRAAAKAAREQELEGERQKQLEVERRRREAAEKKRLAEEEERRAVREEQRQKPLSNKVGSGTKQTGPGVAKIKKTSNDKKQVPEDRKINASGGSTEQKQKIGSSQSVVNTDPGMKLGSDEHETSFTKANRAIPDDAMGAHVPEADKDNTEKFDKLCARPAENQEEAEVTQQPSSEGASLAEGAHQDGRKGDASAGAEGRKVEGQRAADDSQINEPGFGRRTPQIY